MPQYFNVLYCPKSRISLFPAVFIYPFGSFIKLVDYWQGSFILVSIRICISVYDPCTFVIDLIVYIISYRSGR